MKNKICIYAICKNESKFIDKWLESMSEADYICVLDTGSTDDTYNKFKELSLTDKRYIGKLIVDQKQIVPWRFDVARNESLKLVPEDCNILMCTDLDELLESGWAEVLRNNWIEGKHQRGIYKYTWSHTSDGGEGRTFQYDKIHSKGWIWKYPVHELLWNEQTKSNNYNIEETLMLFNEIHLHHWPDNLKSRGSYLPLLELREMENEEDYYGLIYLSHEYFYRGFYEKSIEKLTKVLEKYKDVSSSVEKASCYLFIGDNYTELEQYEDAIQYYSLGIISDPTYRECYLNLAKVLIKLNKYSTAKSYLKLMFENTYRHYTWLERDLSWSSESYDLMSLASYYSGDKKTALVNAVKAYHENTLDERLKDNIDKILNNMELKDFC